MMSCCFVSTPVHTLLSRPQRNPQTPLASVSSFTPCVPRRPASIVFGTRRLETAFRQNESSKSRITMASGSSPVYIRIIAAVMIGGLVIASFLPVLDALRGSRGGSFEALLESQLSRVPVFTVTDTSGRPYLSETEDHRLRRGYFFVQPADAETFLEQIKPDNDDAKVLAIGLNKAVTLLGPKPSSAKSVPEKFELFPDSKQASVARELTDGQFEKNFGEYGVPLFYIDGLAVKDEKQDTAVYPLFFEKAKLDEALANLRKSDPKSSLSVADVQIVDLAQTIKEIRAGTNPRLTRVVFVPTSDSLEKLKAINKEASSP